MRIHATTQDASSSALDAIVMTLRVFFWAWVGFIATASALAIAKGQLGELETVSRVGLVCVPVDFAAFAFFRALKAGRLRWSRPSAN